MHCDVITFREHGYKVYLNLLIVTRAIFQRFDGCQHYRWQGLCLANKAFSREGFTTCHTCCNMGPWFIWSHPNDWSPCPTCDTRLIRYLHHHSNFCARGATNTKYFQFQSSNVESENYTLVIQKIRPHSGDPENQTTLWWSRKSDHTLVILKISNTAIWDPPKYMYKRKI
jgi:hypothetical protein